MAKKKKNEEYPGYIKAKVNKGSLALGKKVPGFKVASTGEVPFSLNDYKEQIVVIYFYPKDHTPGCTVEGHDFTKFHKKFKKLDAHIFGVSRESLDSHEKFITKQGYSFDLLCDEDETICNFFEVMKEKNMYGRKYMGIERSTFVIGGNGKLLKEWRKVKVPGHVEEVYDFVKSL